MDAQTAFRKLRERWFLHKLQYRGPEREWETDSEQEMRDRQNAAMKAKFDAQTEAILRGEDFEIAPMCGRDLERNS